MLEVHTEGLDFTVRRMDASIERLREALVGTHFAERDLFEARIADLEEQRDRLVAAMHSHHRADIAEPQIPGPAAALHAVPLRRLPRFARRARGEESRPRNDLI